MNIHDSLGSNQLGPEIIRISGKLIERINGNPAILAEANPEDLADILETGRAMIKSPGKENFGLIQILVAIQSNQSIGAIASKGFLQAVEEFIEGKSPDDQRVMDNTAHEVVEETVEEMSDADWIAKLVSDLAVHIEFHAQIDPSRIDVRTRSSLEKANIELDESDPNDAIRKLVDYVGTRLNKPNLQEGTRNYYLNTLLPKIAELYGFRQEEDSSNPS